MLRQADSSPGAAPAKTRCYNVSNDLFGVLIAGFGGQFRGKFDARSMDASLLAGPGSICCLLRAAMRRMY